MFCVSGLGICIPRFTGSISLFLNSTPFPLDLSQVYPELRAYRWTHANSYFMFSTPNVLAMGGGFVLFMIFLCSQILFYLQLSSIFNLLSVHTIVCSWTQICWLATVESVKHLDVALWQGKLLKCLDPLLIQRCNKLCCYISDQKNLMSQKLKCGALSDVEKIITIATWYILQNLSGKPVVSFFSAFMFHLVVAGYFCFNDARFATHF